MQTHFSPLQLADADTAESERILRACVHCGFCTATCPTYVLLGDELDSPRGRIYLIKDMLERGKAASATVVKHIDRCLSCLSCMSTCPSSVHYMHLVDHARGHIERTYRRPFVERWMRTFLAAILPRPGLFRIALAAALAVRPLRRGLPRRLRATLDMLPWHLAKDSLVDSPQVFPAQGARRMRVALLSGCVQRVLAPAINEATVRLLTRLGCEVVVARGAGCCGALAHHLGKHPGAARQAKANVAAWLREADGGGLDAIVVNASGCGVMVKDLWLSAARGWRVGRGGGANLRPRARCIGGGGGAGAASQGQRQAAARRLSLGRARWVTARASTTDPQRCSATPASRSMSPPKRIYVAARPAPTTFCSPRSRPRSWRARWRPSSAWSRR